MSMFRCAVILTIFCLCSFTGSADELTEKPVETKIYGSVLLPNGTPARSVNESVKIGLATHTNSIMVMKDEIMKFNGKDRYYTSTGKDGRFEFAPIDLEKESAQRRNMLQGVQIEMVDFILIFMHSTGFKRLTQQDWEALDENKTVMLEPWSKITGNVRVGTKSGGNLPLACRVQFENNGQVRSACEPFVEVYCQATSDEDGKFSIDRVPASSVRIARVILYNIITDNNGRRTSSYGTDSHTSDEIELHPGETFDVWIGGVGRPVVGKVVPSEEFKTPPDLRFAHIICMEKFEATDPMDIWERMIPKEVMEAGIPFNKMKWLNWLLSFEGKQYQADVERAIQDVEEARKRNWEKYTKKRVCAVAQDGTFRLDDIPAGNWQLEVVIEDSAQGQPGMRPIIGLLEEHEFRVPTVLGGVSDDPLDIGTLEVEPATVGGNRVPAGLRR